MKKRIEQKLHDPRWPSPWDLAEKTPLSYVEQEAHLDGWLRGGPSLLA